MFSAIYILPSVRIGFDFVSLAIASFIFYLLFAYKSDKFVSVKDLVFNLLPYMLICFLIAKPMDFKMGFLHPLLTTWCMLFPGLLCKHTLERGNKFECRLIALITMGMLIYVIYNTINALIVSPDILRDITGGLLDEEIQLQYVLGNVGGYGLAYGTGAVVILLITLLEGYQKSRKIKLLLYALLVVVVYFVLNAQFTTLLFLTFICTILSLYYSDYGQRNKFFLIMLIVIFVFFTPILLQFVTSLYEGTTTGEKLVRFTNNIFGNGDVTEASGARSKAQLNALSLFFKSPLWGSDIVNNTQNASIYGAAHSTMLGVACSTGLIGLVSYYKTYWSIMKAILKKYVGKGKQYIAIVIYFFLFSLFNPSESTESCWIIFMIVPLFFNVIKQYNNE